MKIIAITPELSHPDEINFIIKMLDAGFDYVHIRKPGFPMQQMREYIKSIPPKYYDRLKIHNHFELAHEFNLAGIHLNMHCNVIPPNCENLSRSRSCHSENELTDLNQYEYVFLSPIFDSISKNGYKSKFSYGNLLEIFKHDGMKDKIIALGGIMPFHLKQLHNIGFAGAAFLGYLFNSSDIESLNKKIELIKSSNAAIHY